jgi:hypothetical protein
MKAYIIKFRTNESFQKGFKFLLSKGFVFTTDRIKTFEKAEYEYNTLGWKIIYLGHNDCRMVMNTSSICESKMCNINEPFILTSFSKFKKDILPTYC